MTIFGDLRQSLAISYPHCFALHDALIQGGKIMATRVHELIFTLPVSFQTKRKQEIQRHAMLNHQINASLLSIDANLLEAAEKLLDVATAWAKESELHHQRLADLLGKVHRQLESMA